jgi:hypothetical protein
VVAGVVTGVVAGVVTGVVAGVVTGVVAGVVAGVVTGVVAVVPLEVVGGGVVEQLGDWMRLSSNVTAEVRASRRPVIWARVLAVIDARAIAVPISVESVPRVTELPICQKTLQGFAPLIMATTLEEAVISVLADLNMNTAFESFWALSVSVPVIARVVPT